MDLPTQARSLIETCRTVGMDAEQIVLAATDCGISRKAAIEYVIVSLPFHHAQSPGLQIAYSAAALLEQQPQWLPDIAGILDQRGIHPASLLTWRDIFPARADDNTWMDDPYPPEIPDWIRSRYPDPATQTFLDAVTLRFGPTGDTWPSGLKLGYLRTRGELLPSSLPPGFEVYSLLDVEKGHFRAWPPDGPLSCHLGIHGCGTPESLAFGSPEGLCLGNLPDLKTLTVTGACPISIKCCRNLERVHLDPVCGRLCIYGHRLQNLDTKDAASGVVSSSLETLPEGLDMGSEEPGLHESLLVDAQGGFRHVPDGLHCRGDARFSHLPSMDSWGRGIRIDGDLLLMDLPRSPCLPEDLMVQGRVRLWDPALIARLPPHLQDRVQVH